MEAKEDNGTECGPPSTADTDIQKNTKFEINRELLQLILDEDVESFHLSEGSAPGDSYMSILHAVEIQIVGRSKPRHILIKCLPNQKERREFSEKTDIFGKEFFFYAEWAPMMQKLGGGHSQLELSIPEFLGGNRAGFGQNRVGSIEYPEPWKNQDFIAMTDLRGEHGFKMASRIDGVSVDQAIQVMKQLGNLHALSWVYKVTSGLERLIFLHPDLLDKGYSTLINDSFQPLVDLAGKTVMGFVAEKYGEESKIYAGLKKLYSHDTMKLLRKLSSHDPIVEEEVEDLLRIRDSNGKNFVNEPWQVAIHGDCWVNNVMFNYNSFTTDAKVKDLSPNQVVLLDFQIIHEGCPTMDIANFLYSSTTPETRKGFENDILRAYYDQFILVCDTLDCKPLPGFCWATLKRRFRRAKIYGFLITIVLLNLLLQRPEDALELESVSGGIADVFSSALTIREDDLILKRRALELVEEFYEQGIF